MSSHTSLRDSTPALRLLSLGAGVQSTAVLLLACDGVIPRFDYALFADTRWEPSAVYENLTHLAEHAERPTSDLVLSYYPPPGDGVSTGSPGLSGKLLDIGACAPKTCFLATLMKLSLAASIRSRAGFHVCRSAISPCLIRRVWRKKASSI